VQASFGHAIHFGMFSVIGDYIYYDRFPRNGLRAFMTVLALSSSWGYGVCWSPTIGMSPVAYIVSELVINQVGAEGRLDQITYGLKGALRRADLRHWSHTVSG
jgi:hypothetical protein